ncbi:MAG: hypothetical protein WBR26_04105 [Candidatus Acidiferrum sp.]
MRTIISSIRMMAFGVLTLLCGSIVYGQHAPYDQLALRTTTSVGGTRVQGATETAAQNHGVIHVDGATYTSANAALAACPPGGCVIDMRGNPSSAALDLTSFDPGGLSVTLLLGPYTYNVETITLRSNLNITGNGTTLQSVSKNNKPVFVLPQTNNTPASNVTLQNFRMLGALGNTSQDGFDLDCSKTVGNGLFYSLIRGITIQRFNGVSIRLRGPNNGFASNNQFSTFENIFVFRGSSRTSGEALRLEGANSNLTFIECQLDGNSGQWVGTNVYLGVLKGGRNGYPLSVHFYGTISQAADVAVVINGSVNLDFHNTHHEAIKTGGYLITNGAFNIGVLIERTYFAADGSYNNSGEGYLVKSASGSVQNDIVFTNNVFGQFGKAPDNVLVGEAQWTACGNFGPSTTFQPCQFTGQVVQAANFQANQGKLQSSTNISLGAGWGAGAKVTDVKGWTQTEQFIINSGSGSFATAPTVSVRFPNPFPQPPLCSLTVQDVTGNGGAILFNSTFLSDTMATFTAENPGGTAFTPASDEKYTVLMRCGP